MMLCSYVFDDQSECTNAAALSIGLEDERHIEVCAEHLTPEWLSALCEHYGTVYAMRLVVHSP